MSRNNPRSLLACALTILALGLPFALLAPPAQIAFRTAALLPAFFGQSWFSTSAIAVDDQPLSGSRMLSYRPRTGRNPALIISLGVEPAPPDDPRVVSLLRGLAGIGIDATLVESDELDAGRLSSNAPKLLVSAFEKTSQQPFVIPDRVGFLGLSAGGSLALIASADPRIAQKVRLIEAVGAYDRLLTLARSVVTTSLAGGETWLPAPLARDAVRTNLIALAPPADQQALQSAADEANVSPADLSPTGAAILGLISAKSGSDFDNAARFLPLQTLASLNQLSPASVLTNTQAPVFLIVDRSDSYVPAGESAAIAEQLRRSNDSVYFSHFDIFRHVEPGAGAAPLTLARNLVRLFFHIASVLARLQG
jgi:fermentation-respiration switch protein FrsA (DUF1100 family)